MEVLHGHQDGSARWIVVITAEGAEPVHVALGDPVPGWTQKLYLPQWLVETCGLQGEGEEVRVRFERCESFLKAEKLGFQVIGDIPRDMDLRELLEEPLSQLGVLQAGQIIPVPLFEGAHLMLKTCEPGGFVFLDGAEVSLEIEDDSPPAAEPLLPQELPVPEAPEAPEVPEAPPQMLPPSFTQTPLTPSFPTPRASAFIPFSGTGNRLCD